jgi:uncharacterized integral membrane protein
MQNFFNWLYPLVVSWFYQKKSVSFGLYKAEVFNSVGFYTVLLALALVLVFYFIFNNARISLNRLGWSRPMHWVLVWLAAAGLGALVAYRVSMQQGIAADAYLRYFIIANTLVAALWFLIFSLLLKRLPFGSQARAVPFL